MTLTQAAAQAHLCSIRWLVQPPRTRTAAANETKNTPPHPFGHLLNHRACRLAQAKKIKT